MLAGSCPTQDTENDWTLYEIAATYSTYSTDQFQTHNASDYDLGWLYLYSVEITKGDSCCCVAAALLLSLKTLLLVVIMKSKELKTKTYSHAHSLILSHHHSALYLLL